MMHADVAKPRTRLNPREQKTCPYALAIFLLVYIGILTVIFAPTGTFVSDIPAAQTQR